MLSGEANGVTCGFAHIDWSIVYIELHTFIPEHDLWQVQMCCQLNMFLVQELSFGFSTDFYALRSYANLCKIELSYLNFLTKLSFNTFPWKKYFSIYSEL